MAISLVFATQATICVLKNQNNEAMLKREDSLKNILKKLHKRLSIALAKRLNLLRNKIKMAELKVN